MITFKQLNTLDGKRLDLQAAYDEEATIAADELMLLPAVIDPHVHFRTPGMEHKEDWRTGARAALRGGCTMVFDMPNTQPPTITATLLQEKNKLVAQQLKEADIPLRYHLFFGADKQHLHEINGVQKAVIGIKVFMGCSTGNLVIDDDESLHAVFAIAAQHNMVVAVHAEDEQLLNERKKNFTGSLSYAVHSQWRDVEVAVRAVEKAISLARRYHTRLYILHVSTAEEIALIKAAKQEGLAVFAETTPHHLFFDTSSYAILGGKAVVNPPLRDKKNHAALFAAIHEKIIDTIGSDHAPHTVAEKSQAYGQCPSGMPGIEFMLPLLLNAQHAGHLSLEEVVSLTSKRAREIFHLPDYADWVIVDREKQARITSTHSKCGWSPYMGLTLRGWPVYTIIDGRCYKNL